MAAACPAENPDFPNWLSGRLRELHADDEVFGPYILSILEEEAEEDVMTSLADVLEGLGLDSSLPETDAASPVYLKKEIHRKWIQSRAASAAVTPAPSGDLDVKDLQTQLADITEQRSEAYAATKASSKSSEKEEADRRAVKAAILSQYQEGEEVTDDEAEDEDDAPRDMMKNLNAELVAKAEQEKREKGRQAAMAKKEKDKEDREKQKKQAEERKKKAQEKASKGERRR